MNIYKRRVLNIARALRESPNPDKFYMSSVLDRTCGTPSCAFGHYVCRTDLQDEFAPRILDGFGWAPYFVDGRYALFMRAEVHNHFGLTAGEADLLFNGGTGCGFAETPRSERTALAAAEFIERFAAKKWSELSTEELVAELMTKVMGEKIPEYEQKQ
jgi:hypothetical protein